MEKRAINIKGLKKKYKLYSNKQDRLKETLSISKKIYHKDFLALDDISFDVVKGETVGIIGTNGSGKSTLLKIITGVLSPTEGEVFVDGKISALLELGTGFNQEYTGIENIYLNGRMMGYSKKEMEKRVPQIIDFADIGEFINQPVKTYSSGMFARLAFAVAINVEPDILIVDEALSVGDLFFQNKCFKKFDELRDKGVTILFVSHDISSVRQMCSRVLWIEKGVQKIFDNSDKVCDLYMDMKRIGMNELLDHYDKNSEGIKGIESNENKIIPKISFKKSELMSDEFEIISGYFQDNYGNVTTKLVVDEEFTTHVFVKFNIDMSNIIIGFVLENSKGIPLYDINNYINQQQGVYGKKGEILEIVYKYKMPRLMKGMYIVSIAIAQGTQEKHVMKTWLHGTNEIEIVNTGYNSSYIEIPSDIDVNYYKEENIAII
jgi:ABC-type polysaccharide/polyol phosphate transport system ATPase subunit